ncbi:hypothetical protein ATDW_24150 [Asticcacaulis sp. DW145]|uniref:hypothetical protein n=1 Tax=Asticcacaulis sp. DW145 TaxID=3095608 RepID=UPI00309197F6|nr:hypothetical protein ATDW_24150 [Asticcacaulis sp. DW145]
MIIPRPENIGHDILYYDGSNPHELAELKGRVRFLNKLWLPCALELLSPEQIFVTNRFRESVISTDTQFLHASFMRSCFIQILNELEKPEVIEIGCGKFPLATNSSFGSYLGLEIDSEAVDFCTKKGFDVILCSAGKIKDVALEIKYDFCVGLYSFHFDVSEEVIDFVHRHLKDSGCVMFNVIVDDSEQLAKKF